MSTYDDDDDKVREQPHSEQPHSEQPQSPHRKRLKTTIATTTTKSTTVNTNENNQNEEDVDEIVADSILNQCENVTDSIVNNFKHMANTTTKILEWNDTKIIDQISLPIQQKSQVEELETNNNDNNNVFKEVVRMDEKYTLPPELQIYDFTSSCMKERGVQWNKYSPYNTIPVPLVPLTTEPQFTINSPTLCHYIHAISGRARACTIYFIDKNEDNNNSNQQKSHRQRPLPTPMFMPVGTKGCMKALSMNELTCDPALQCPIILANTYHLAIQPGTDLIGNTTFNGLHNFQGLDNILQQKQTNDQNHNDQTHNTNHLHDKGSSNSTTNQVKALPYNLLTDSGGFQMVSLAKLSQVTEDGVSFENPYKQNNKKKTTSSSSTSSSIMNDAAKRYDLHFKNIDTNVDNENTIPDNGNNNNSDILLLRPEDSIRHQNNIGSNIIMALDDVISSVTADEQRFVTATHRTLRWYDRCYKYLHSNDNKHRLYQNLFPIVQGGLDTSVGGLREQCLAGFQYRHVTCNYSIPGYAIGGLAGGESKDEFWKVVNLCCIALPDNKPRYLMGVGYPLDIVICTALGVDMYDCVYPTRTARFGVALVPTKGGTIRLTSNVCSRDTINTIQNNCICQCCRTNISRSRIHTLIKSNNPVGVQLVTQHNIAYMMSLMKSIRQAIIDNTFEQYVIQFIITFFDCNATNWHTLIPQWVIDALLAATINIPHYFEPNKQ